MIEQSFSMYMPYADVTIFSVVVSAHLSAIMLVHCAWTALYSASPVRLAILAPPVKSVVAQMAFILPAISSVPWVDKDLVLDFDKTSLMPASCNAADDLSLVVC